MQEPNDHTIIVGGVVRKNGKYLLIQEAKEKWRNKWFIEAGHLEPNETILEGAKREIFEECGCKVELTGVCLIHHVPARNLLGIFFATKIIQEQTSPLNPEEILSSRWFTFEEICAMGKQDKLRVAEMVLGAIQNIREGRVAPLELVTSLLSEKSLKKL